MKNSDRIALYFFKLGGTGGGAERMICQLANELSTRGFSVFLISWDAENATSFYPIQPSVSWKKLGLVNNQLGKLRRFFVLYTFLKRSKINVLIGFVMSGDRTVFSAAKLAKTKIVVAERNSPKMYYFRYGAIKRFLTFNLLRFVDCVTIQIESYRSGYPSFLHKQIVTIPNPVPKARSMAQPDIPDANGRFKLLVVSRLEPLQKNISCIVEAFAKIASIFPSWDLRIIGDGLEQNKLQSKVTTYQLENRVRIEASNSDIFSAYISSHLFAISSRWEGFPNALAEAMSHGLPTVGFEKASGVAELISEGGWLAAGLDDEASFAATLAYAFENAEERRQRGIAAAQIVDKFEPEYQFDRWAKLINSIAIR